MLHINILSFSPFLIPLVIVAIIIWLAFYFEKKRREALSNAAVGIGFFFEPKGDQSFVSSFTRFTSFHGGHSYRARNVMRGRRGGIGFTIFDFKYTVGYGKHSRTYNHTIALVKLGVLAPTFYLTKESFLHKLGEAFGSKDIDFEANPAFSDKYFLRGTDEAAVKKLFSSSVMSFFETMELKFTVEAEGDTLVVFRPGKKVKPADLNSFIQQVSSIVNVFRKELEK
ncbi:MAG: hypothetical protein ISS25_01655 [Nanoarchaeota archaeon]|nr:hypothetical protein [DPANN group archaeon]MBL7116515.1 hypothetical protein [Nanoarchaeota archaeon]